MPYKMTINTTLPAAVEMPKTLQAHSRTTHRAEPFMTEVNELSFTTFIDSYVFPKKERKSELKMWVRLATLAVPR